MLKWYIIAELYGLIRRHNRHYNRTHVILGEGRRDRPIAGFPFIRDANRLRSLLLHRFRLVEQRQLIKLLDICNSPGKRKRRITICQSVRFRRSNLGGPYDRFPGRQRGISFRFHLDSRSSHATCKCRVINWHSSTGDLIYSAYIEYIETNLKKKYNVANGKQLIEYRTV